MTRIELHGGTDQGPAVTWDFSSNANAVALPPALRDRLLCADRTRYPEPGYNALRARLAAAHQVEPGDVVPTAGSSEAIRRLTLAACVQGVRQVCVPRPGYGDYAAAAQALGMRVVDDHDPEASLRRFLAHPLPQLMLWWLCEPASPTGASLPPAFWAALQDGLNREPRLIVAIDRAYEPLRLLGADPMERRVTRQCWTLWSPNKALGLTGVRAGWMLAPAHACLLDQVEALAPSWVLSAEGEALARHWHDADVQHWLAGARVTLRSWASAQATALSTRSWAIQPSCTNFMWARPPCDHAQDLPDLLRALRAQGIKLRTGDSFGAPDHVRLRVLGPAALSALLAAWDGWCLDRGMDRRSAA